MIYTLQATGASNLIFIIAMFAIMFAFMIYPQMRRQKQEKKFLDEIKKGDKVVMKSGLHGRVLELHNNTVVIETMAGKLQFERGAISLDYTKRVQNEK